MGEFRGKILKCVIRVGFYERRLQFMEKDLLHQWKQQRSTERILEIDIPLSYGVFEIIHKDNEINKCEFAWDPTKETGVFVKVNCISTEFTPKKHGGEKGVPFRLIIETHWYNNNSPSMNTCIDGASCQVKVFKPKGADRKHKTDKEKMLKRSPMEQQKYLPSFDCTVFTQCPLDTLYLAGGGAALMNGSAVAADTFAAATTSGDGSAQVTTSEPNTNGPILNGNGVLIDTLHPINQAATNGAAGNFSPEASSGQSSGTNHPMISNNTNMTAVATNSASKEECKPNVCNQNSNGDSNSPIVAIGHGSSSSSSSLLQHQTSSSNSIDGQSLSAIGNGNTVNGGDSGDLSMPMQTQVVNSSSNNPSNGSTITPMQCSTSTGLAQQQSPVDNLHLTSISSYDNNATTTTVSQSMHNVSTVPPPPSSSAELAYSADTIDNWQPLLAGLSSEQTNEWLHCNRFDKYGHVFQQFTSSDLLRMSREDLMQMCEMPDAIRLYNRLHARPAGPLLTLYVCLDGQPVFRALYLSSFRLTELRPKLVRILFDNSVDCELLMQNLNRLLLCGPHEIRVLLTDEVLANLPDESMFVVRLDQGVKFIESFKII